MSNPELVMMAAVSLDGFIAKHESEDVWFTSPEDKKVLREQIQKSDYLVVGRKTFDLSKDILKKRPCLIISRNAKQEFPGTRALTWVDFVQELKQEKFTHKRLLILGGAEIYTLALRDLALATIYLTIEPWLLGSGVPLLHSINSPKKLLCQKVETLNGQGTLFLTLSLK